MKNLNVSAIDLDENGKVVLSDDELAGIEQSFVPTAGGASSNAGSCTNGQCDNSTNDNNCSNTGSCSGASNMNVCRGKQVN